jgi:ribosome-binding protein aMBF1 (putative translation factor)
VKYKKTKKGVEYTSLGDLKRAARRDPAFRKAQRAIKTEYDIIRAILDARIRKGLTQAELARRAGTTQSAIARFESGAGNPTLDFLSKVSIAVNARLEVRVVK